MFTLMTQTHQSLPKLPISYFSALSKMDHTPPSGMSSLDFDVNNTGKDIHNLQSSNLMFVSGFINYKIGWLAN